MTDNTPNTVPNGLLEIDNTQPMLPKVTLDGKDISDHMNYIKFIHDAGNWSDIVMAFAYKPTKLMAQLRIANVEVQYKDVGKEGELEDRIEAMHEELHNLLTELHFWKCGCNGLVHKNIDKEWVAVKCKFCDTDKKKEGKLQ